jgi:hypothetical protein
MGILESLPPGLIIFLTWLIVWVAASITILIISVGLGRLLGDFLDGIIGYIK